MGGNAGKIGLGGALGGLGGAGAAMAGGKGSGAPSAPDFAGMAERQAASGHVNQTNPFGSTSWMQGPDGRWTQNTSLTGPTTEDAVYKQFASRLDPQWGQREEQMKSQLAAQGLDPGSEAYNNAYGNFSRGRNDAYQSAQNQAQTTGYNESLGALGTLSGQGPQTQYLPAAMAAYQGALQGYGIDQASKNSMMNGLGSLGGNAAMFAAL